MMTFGDWRRWLNKLSRSARRRAAGRKRAPSARPRLEALEDRALMAVVLVNSVGESGDAPSAIDNDFTRIQIALDAAQSGDTIQLNGIFDLTEGNANASWAKGKDGIAGNADDYRALVSPGIHNVTLTAGLLGDATIQGPGDLASFNQESFLRFSGGDNQNWTISNLRILDFDLAIGMFNGAGGADAFDGTTITNNYIRVAADLNAVEAPADSGQNIGIHYSFGKNQTISNNVIEIPGTGVSDPSADLAGDRSKFSTTVGMQSNTSGSSYDGLVITGNEIHVLNFTAANRERIIGIWENAHGHLSDIEVSNNKFLNLDADNDSSLNLQQAFWITSHSGVATTVTYSGNQVEGASIGFKWLGDPEFPGQNYSAHQAVRLWGNTVVGSNTGVLIQGGGAANLFQNTIIGSGVGGAVKVVNGRLTGSGSVTNAVQENDLSGGDGDAIVLDVNSSVTGGIYNNNLATADVGIRNSGAGVVNASRNWWGTSTAAGVADEISGNVDFMPILVTGEDTDLLTAGFQGNFAPLAVDDSYTLEEDGSPIYSQDFESSADGWLTSSGGAIEMTDDGNAIFTQTGSGGPFTRFDGYQNIFPQGGFIAGIKVYLDTNWALGSGFDYSVAASSSSGQHLRDFIFHVTKDSSTGKLLVAGSNNSNFNPREDLETLNHYEVTTSGWYTLQHDFHDKDGVLEVHLNLLDEHGNVVFTETRSSASDQIASVVGGNRYGWFTNIDIAQGVAVAGSSLVRSPTRGSILANDSFPSGTPDGQSAQLVQAPQHAYSFTLMADGSFTYVPLANYFGTDSFTYQVIDNGDTSNVATVTLNISAVNDAPVAGDDSESTLEMEPVTIDVLANDSDVEGTALTPPVILTGPAFGTALVNADGTITYTPAAGFTGTDTFTYMVSDGSVGTVATVSVTVDALPPGVTIRDGELFVSGSEDSDNIVIRRQGTSGLRVTTLIDGQMESKVYTGITAIRIHVRGGDDRVSIARTLALPVTVVGGEGNDFITTAGGQDVVYGDAIDGSGDGDDTIFTGAGNDFVSAGNGDNVIDAGHGANTVNAASGANSITSGAGVDTIVVGDGVNFIQAGHGANTITAGHGANSISTGIGADVIHAGHGRNWVSSSGGNDRVELGDGGNTVLAGAGADVVITGAESDSIFGGGGDDLILAGDGDDVVRGGLGSDVLVGGHGADIVAGENGRDLLFAGEIELLTPVSDPADAMAQLLSRLRRLQLAWNPARGPLPTVRPNLANFGLEKVAEPMPTLDQIVGGAQFDLLWSDDDGLDQSTQ